MKRPNFGLNGSEGPGTCLDLLHVRQLLLHGTAVATLGPIASGHHRAIFKKGSKSKQGGLEVLHVLQLVSHRTAVATCVGVAP